MNVKRPEVLEQTSESLVALIDEMLKVPVIDDQSPDEWRISRARNITQVLTQSLVGYDKNRREVGCLPLTFIDDITERIVLSPTPRAETFDAPAHTLGCDCGRC